jgi:hypothetical protein
MLVYYSEIFLNTVISDEDGYYAFGNLGAGVYRIVPEYLYYNFEYNPGFVIIPVSENMPFDFTSHSGF